MGRPSKRTPEREASPQVYLIWAKNTSVFKIGYTSGPIEKRHKALQAASPLPLYVVGLMSGTRADEKALHRRFAQERIHGEWFATYDEATTMEMLKAYGALEALRATGESHAHPAWLLAVWLAAQRLKSAPAAVNA